MQSAGPLNMYWEQKHAKLQCVSGQRWGGCVWRLAWFMLSDLALKMHFYRQYAKEELKWLPGQA